MPIPWTSPLRVKHGGQSLLGGIDVYHDFDWRDVIGHPRGAFPRGQKLAQMVKAACPANRKPVLLLTIQEDVEDQTIITDEHYVVVVPIKKYLLESTPDPAASYFAKRLASKTGTPSLHRISEIVKTPKDLDVILNEHLDEEALRRWVRGNDTRIAALHQLSREYEKITDISSTDAADVVSTIAKLEALPGELLDALVLLTERSGTRALEDLADGLTSSAAGRVAAAGALAERVGDRIRDAREAARKYRGLVQDRSATETDLQTFIEQTPWILGLEYVKVTPRRPVVRGEVDFLVQRHDGFHDFLELKGPNAVLVRTIRPQHRADMPNAPSGYTLGPDLAQALAQVQYYREMFTHQESAMETYGIRRTRYPRALIVLGRFSDLDEIEGMILHQLNQSLHRVEVLAYDILASRVEAQLDSVERLMVHHRLNGNISPEAAT